MKMRTKGMLLTFGVAVLLIAYFAGNRPPHFPPIPPRPLPSPNAYDIDSLAEKSAEEHEDALNTNFSTVSAYSRLTAKQRFELLQAVTPCLNTVRAGFAFKYACPRASLESWGKPRYYYNRYELAQLFDLEGRMKADRGDWCGAASSFIDAIKLGVDIPHGAGTMEVATGYRCEETGQKGMFTVVPNLTVVQLEACKRRLIAIESDRSPFGDSVRESKYWSEVGLIEAFKDRNWASKMSHNSMISMGASSALGATITSGILGLNVMIDGKRGIYEQNDRYYDALIKAAQFPYAAHAAVERVSLDPQTRTEDAAFGVDPYKRDSWFQAFSTEGAAENDTLIVAMSLQQYHLRHHSYPRSLSQLVPTELTVVPRDPFTLGKPLHYRQTGPEYLLYSVGPDGIDDGGAPIYGPVIQTSKGDVVYGINP